MISGGRVTASGRVPRNGGGACRSGWAAVTSAGGQRVGGCHQEVGGGRRPADGRLSAVPWVGGGRLSAALRPEVGGGRRPGTLKWDLDRRRSRDDVHFLRSAAALPSIPPCGQGGGGVPKSRRRAATCATGSGRRGARGHRRTVTGRAVTGRAVTGRAVTGARSRDAARAWCHRDMTSSGVPGGQSARSEPVSTCRLRRAGDISTAPGGDWHRRNVPGTPVLPVVTSFVCSL